ncbi:MAG: PAS domain-containing protein, partial [Verrucomicrobia bacterium]|nr:PAS domain-containing protein [Verrucomicrobiota bacterium]
MRTKFSHLLGSIVHDEAVTLEVRLYRLFAATTCLLCLLVVLPMNLLQNLPGLVNIVDSVLGLIGGGCFWLSLRGRHFPGWFFGVVMVMFNLVWFANAGSEGSIPYYFFPILLYPLTIFHGLRRRICTAVVVCNVCGLLVLERFVPELLVPFQSPTDRTIDLSSGAFASSLALIVIVRLILVAYDQEQRRLVQYSEKLAASEQGYRQIFNATSDALSIREVDGTLIDVNDRFCALFGHDRSAVFRLSINDISLGVSPYSQTEALEWLRRAVAEGPQTFVWRSRRSDGELFWSEIALRASDVSEKKRLVTAIRDISRRREASENLRIQEERLRLALEASKQGWFDINVQTGEGRASGEYAKIIGLEPVEFKVSAREWMDGIHPDDRETAANAFHECIATRQTRTLEYRRRAQSGDWKWIRSVGKIVESDSSGKALRMLGTHTDIT